MISTIDIKCNAAHPEMALPTFYSFKNSWSTLRVLDVPKKTGLWEITGIVVQAHMPDNTICSTAAVKAGCLWLASIAPTETAGKSTFGYKILAQGKDENGDPVQPWVLGKGDVVILEDDGSVAPVPGVQYMCYIDESELPVPLSALTKGTMWLDAGEDVFKVWDGEEAQAFPTKHYVDSALSAQELTPEQLSAIQQVVDERRTHVVFQYSSIPVHRSYDYTGKLYLNQIPDYEALRSIKVGTGVSAIGTDTGPYNYSMKSLTLPDSIIEIDDSAFAYQRALRDLVIPDSVSAIGATLFNNIDPTYPVDRLVIGTGVKTIGTNAFKKVRNVYFKDRTMAEVSAMAGYPWGATEWYQKIQTWNAASQEWTQDQLDTRLSNAMTLTRGRYTGIPTNLPYGAMAVASSGELGDEVLVRHDTNPTIVQIPTETWATNKIQQQIMPVSNQLNNLQTATENGLSSLSAQTSYLSGVIDTVSEQVGGKQDALTQNQMAAINNDVNSQATVLNDGAKTLLVTELLKSDIGDTRVETAKFGSELETIGLSAFANQDELYELDFGDCKKLTRVGDYAFDGCWGLGSAELPEGVDSIGIKAFADTALTRLTLPSTVGSIGHNAFLGTDPYMTVLFKEKTLAQVQAMQGYPWGLDSPTTQIECVKTATQEWVEQQIGSFNEALEEIVG